MPLKEQRPWYENALLLTVAGSIIVVVGQLAGTIIPIMYGPADISDFSIRANPAYINISDDKTYSTLASGEKFFVVRIGIDDFHPYLRPYRYDVYLSALNLPKEVQSVNFHPAQTKTGRTVYMTFVLEKAAKLVDYPIKIRGIGEDGKVRNSTIYLSLY